MTEPRDCSHQLVTVTIMHYWKPSKWPIYLLINGKIFMILRPIFIIKSAAKDCYIENEIIYPDGILKAEMFFIWWPGSFVFSGNK